MKPVQIVGAGLAGSEAAWQLARSGIPVELVDMRPAKSTPAHKTDLPGELVCSNSLGSDNPDSPPGLLKWEMEMLNSLVIESARQTRVPAGGALAVDREAFSRHIKSRLQNTGVVDFICREVTKLETGGDSPLTIIATGPLTAEPLAENLREMLGQEHLFFYDAVSPIVSGESIDMSVAFAANRYGKGTPDYLNCPMNRQQYDAFYDALVSARQVNPHGFEQGCFFSGCMPVEEMARRGRKTLLFGPLKPVGLDESAQGVVQLRRENREGTMYSLVGFQTRLAWGEQKRVFRMIPGLEKAEFLRFGVMHRNIYIDSPRHLSSTLQLLRFPRIIIAGQLTGVEGYIESAAMGLLAGLTAKALFNGASVPTPPPSIAMGSLVRYITDEQIKNFQPMNINFGILPSADILGKRRERRQRVIENARKSLEEWLAGLSE